MTGIFDSWHSWLIAVMGDPGFLVDSKGLNLVCGSWDCSRRPEKFDARVIDFVFFGMFLEHGCG